MSTFELGQTLSVPLRITSDGTTPADLTTCLATWTKPDGTGNHAGTVDHPGTGEYLGLFAGSDQAGRWRCTFTGTGTVRLAVKVEVSSTPADPTSWQTFNDPAKCFVDISMPITGTSNGTTAVTVTSTAFTIPDFPTGATGCDSVIGGTTISDQLNAQLPGQNNNDVEGKNSTLNVDASISYKVNNNLEVVVEGVNLTNQVNDQFISRDRNSSVVYNVTGREILAGVRYKF